MQGMACSEWTFTVLIECNGAPCFYHFNWKWLHFYCAPTLRPIRNSNREMELRWHICAIGSLLKTSRSLCTCATTVVFLIHTKSGADRATKLTFDQIPVMSLAAAAATRQRSALRLWGHGPTSALQDLCMGEVPKIWQVDRIDQLRCSHTDDEEATGQTNKLKSQNRQVLPVIWQRS